MQENKKFYFISTLREDSQIEFAMGNVFFARLGVGLHRNISQILAIIDFSSKEIARKTLSVSKNIIGNINLGQTSRLNLDKFGISNDIPECRSALFGVRINYRPRPYRARSYM